jgi:two-component system chemotaxis response regulator CheY
MAGSDSRLRILAVDDSPEVRGVLLAILGPAGYEVTLAEDGNGAEALLGSSSFSLVITDLNMPGRSGLELIRDLRGRGPETPAILLSGSLDEESRREAALLGKVACVEKPFMPSGLLAVIDRLLK